MPFNIIHVGMTLSRFEVFLSNTTRFNYKAGSIPQDTFLSIITNTHNKALIICWAGRFSAQKYRRFERIFHIYVHVESKLQFSLIGNLEQPWKITGLFCFCFGFIHNVSRYLELQLNRAAVGRWCLTTTARATLQ